MAIQRLSPPLTPPTVDVIQGLYKKEFKDAVVSISFWQYVHVLEKLRKTDVLTPRRKSALEELYVSSVLMTSDELAELMHEADRVVAHGQQGLGGLAVKIVEQLENDFSELKTELAQLNGQKTKWFSLVICDFIRHEENGNDIIYYCLKSRFRAAMAHCFEKGGKLCM